ncbi:hypothetical protein F383_30746 [Gossypium arboreum]|uniref:Uncharacterized protein n=1 Tax=Gossypium arboreum TaxID=29729 RepID=A0A0B0PGB5_GOSAR|nr:hypothetical protein F383_30746 [Gossypium arboreum]
MPVEPIRISRDTLVIYITYIN